MPEGDAALAPPIVLDVTSTAQWAGPPVGIVRVERELARWARRNLRNVEFAFFDPVSREFRGVLEPWLDPLLEGDAVSLWNTPSPFQSRGRRLLARALQPLKLRRGAVLALDRLRRGEGPLAPLAARLEDRLAAERHRARMWRPDGSRRAVSSYRAVLGAPVRWHRDSLLVCAGSGWTHHDVQAVMRRKRQSGFRLLLLCHDLIPAMMPQFFPERDVERFAAYMAAALAGAERVVFTSRKVREDAAAFCRARGLELPPAAVVRLGADFAPGLGEPRSPPPPLAPERYALLVSTVEPRKGHDLVWRVWRRLLDAGIPQAAGFHLVFAGRAGWMADEALARLRLASGSAPNRLVWFEGADDALLRSLYAHAAFCLYPSLYEGFGLPVVEAFAQGKPVLASTGGAVPELVGALSPSIDPRDEEGWHDALRRWITDPAARQPFQARIREGFRHPSWHDFSEAFFREARGATRA